MAIKRNSAGFISGFDNRTADFKGKQLVVRELLKYMYDGNIPTVCMGKNFNTGEEFTPDGSRIRVGEPDYDSLTGNLDLGTIGFWHNVQSYYKNVKVGSKLPDWQLVVSYIQMYHAPGDKTNVLYSYLKVRDTESGKEGWVDSRAVDLK